MTVKELHTHLAALMAKDEYLGDATVNYSRSFEPVEGGIITKNTRNGLVALNLAPISLNQMGGF